MRRLLFILMITLMVSPAWATSVLVDHLHGIHEIFGYGSPDVEYGLEAMLPDVDFDYLDKDDIVIDNMLANGSWTVDEASITIEVPANSEMLYGRFYYQGMEFGQQPYVFVLDPDGNYVAAQSNGSFHIEVHLPGTYTINYSSWGVTDTIYEIGTGVNFMTADLLADYDIFCRLWDNTYGLFMGDFLPEYSTYEQNIIDNYILAGGHFLFIKEPLYAIAEKPIIRLYSDRDQTVDLKIDFPGAATYAVPAGETHPSEIGTVYDWSDIRVPAGVMTEILYEGKPYLPIDWLQLSITDAGVTAYNRTNFPLRDVIVYRYNSARDVEVYTLDDIDGHQTVSQIRQQHLTRVGAENLLKTAIHQGGLADGLTETEMIEFQNHYRWVERAMSRAARGDGWQVLYRFGTEPYDALFPLQCAPQPGTITRSMWVMLRDVPMDLPLDQFPVNLVSSGLSGGSTPNDLVYHEYGVIEQPYPHHDASSAREMNFYGWTLHDEAIIFDPTDHVDYDDQPLFHTWGTSAIAQELSTGVDQVAGWVAGAMTIPDDNDVVLMGDADAWTYLTPAGSNPPMTAAKHFGAGKIAVVHDVHILADVYNNRQFINNIVGWMDETFDVVDDSAEAKNWLGQNYPNPFNPSTTIAFRNETAGQVSLKIVNAAGQFVESLVNAHLGAGEHTVTWDAKDRPSGVYHYRLDVGDASQTRKLLLLK